MKNINSVTYRYIIPVHYSSEVESQINMQKTTFAKSEQKDWFKIEFFDIVKNQTQKMRELGKAYERALKAF